MLYICDLYTVKALKESNGVVKLEGVSEKPKKKKTGGSGNTGGGGSLLVRQCSSTSSTDTKPTKSYVQKLRVSNTRVYGL